MTNKIQRLIHKPTVTVGQLFAGLAVKPVSRSDIKILILVSRPDKDHGLGLKSKILPQNQDQRQTWFSDKVVLSLLINVPQLSHVYACVNPVSSLYALDVFSGRSHCQNVRSSVSISMSWVKNDTGVSGDLKKTPKCCCWCTGLSSLLVIKISLNCAPDKVNLWITMK